MVYLLLPGEGCMMFQDWYVGTDFFEKPLIFPTVICVLMMILKIYDYFNVQFFTVVTYGLLLRYDGNKSSFIVNIWYSCCLLGGKRLKPDSDFLELKDQAYQFSFGTIVIITKQCRPIISRTIKDKSNESSFTCISSKQSILYLRTADVHNSSLYATTMCYCHVPCTNNILIIKKTVSAQVVG